jgi:hypothetical protein
MSTIFRQAALDRLSAPENLDEPLNVVPPRFWLAGLSLASLLAVAVVWALLSVVGASASTVAGGALLLEGSGPRLSAVVFVSPLDVRGVRPGMSVQLEVAAFPSAQVGLLRATVASVGTAPATTAQLVHVVGRADQARELALANQIVPVVLRLNADPRSTNGYSWTLPDGGQVRLSAGLFVNATIIHGG